MSDKQNTPTENELHENTQPAEELTAEELDQISAGDGPKPVGPTLTQLAQMEHDTRKQLISNMRA